MLNLFLSLLCWSAIAWGHPHVFIDMDLELTKLDASGFEAKATWFFDEMTSESLIHDYDVNKDQKFGPKEQSKIKKDFANNLGKFNYFTQILIDKKVNPFKVIQAESRIEKRKMSKKVTSMFGNSKGLSTSFAFSFTFKISNTKLAGKNIVMSFYDDTYYSVIYPLKKMNMKKEIVINKNTLKESRGEYHFQIP